MEQSQIINGVNTNAKVFTPYADYKTLNQIRELLNEPITEGTKVRIMPDTHYGAGVSVGTTIALPKDKRNWKVAPQVVGSDLSCGMLSYCIGSPEDIDLTQLDKVVHEQVPSGPNVHTKNLPKQLKDQTEKLINQLSFEVSGSTKGNLIQSMGTLGGGNHFIELSQGQDGNYWLTVHSGSRGFGGLIAKHHSKVARLKDPMLSKQIKNGINFLKYHGRHHEIQGLIQDIKREHVTPQIPYLMDQELDDYLHDVSLAHDYADLSRRTMLNNICQAMGWEVKDQINSVHNYLDLETNIIRKGATSAKLGERLLIPLNMRDGMLICKGLGNDDWNQSAPHGAGRILSRSQAKAELNLASYQEQMANAGVYTTSVGQSTLDEAPDAYKPAEQIKELIGTTVEILDQTKPIYNFKAHYLNFYENLRRSHASWDDSIGYQLAFHTVKSYKAKIKEDLEKELAKIQNLNPQINLEATLIDQGIVSRVYTDNQISYEPILVTSKKNKQEVRADEYNNFKNLRQLLEHLNELKYYMEKRVHFFLNKLETKVHIQSEFDKEAVRRRFELYIERDELMQSIPNIFKWYDIPRLNQYLEHHYLTTNN